jgi:drug/metabolite transporter (DMT)-like permease
VIVLEPAIAIGLGILLLGESVSARQVAGGFVLAIAVVVALLPELRGEDGAPPPAIVPE